MASWLNVREGRTVDTLSVAPEFRVNGEAPNCIARAWIDDNLVPGYVRLSSHVGFFVHQGQVVTKKEFQLFLNGNLEWLEYEQGQPLPLEALQVGRTAQNEPLFVGNVEVEGVVMYGKVQGHVCYVATDSGVIERTSFLLLAIIE
ncbi:Hypothetical predicted protein [Cloeon dipterum]|uniref:Uncharacterized protein n=1 Tax=Cloeon dipterum TaxID=197152 RepID=A0A8S1DVS3_9INSE|nr:Hypothetical predicted protein [Cloeon dipterum]